jgi:flavin-dependent dehydrogenase
MNPIQIVGAGPAGLVAAIVLGRAGRKVRVLEKEKAVGGDPTTHPRIDVTPMDLEPLRELIGIDFSPAAEPAQEYHRHLWGQLYRMDPAPLYLFERGSRPTSLETYLAGLALEAGVEVEFSRPVVSAEDFARLPAGSILATGAHAEIFQALGLPFRNVYVYTSLARFPGSQNRVATYISRLAPQYTYLAATRGLAFAMFFSFQPLSDQSQAAFALEMENREQLRFGSWRKFTETLPIALLLSPKLWHQGKILAGTLGGYMDPFLFHGLHGALFSGWIAAKAILDPPTAKRAFARHRLVFARTLLLRRLVEMTPFRSRILKYMIPKHGHWEWGLPLAIGGIPGYRWNRPWRDRVWMKKLS